MVKLNSASLICALYIICIKLSFALGLPNFLAATKIKHAYLYLYKILGQFSYINPEGKKNFISPGILQLFFL